MSKPARKFILEHHRAPGDTVAMTALVRDIALQYKGEVKVDVRTNFKDVWLHNPHITPMGRGDAGVKAIRLCYKAGIKHAGRLNKIHFLTWFHKDFSDKSKRPVSVQHPRPDLHLSNWEKNNPLVSGRYWVIVAGGKSDNPIKHWGYAWYQETVNRLREHGLRFVQTGAIDRGHYHPPLKNAINLVGQTNLRDLFNLIHHADGVICPITAAMHIAGAFQKPCVVIAGGREEPWWEGYYTCKGYNPFGKQAGPVEVPHKYLHTIGLLDCCPKKGCWRKTLRPGKHQCKKVVPGPAGQSLPKCMAMITVDHVVEAVLDYYYEDEMIPPIQKPTGAYTPKPQKSDEADSGQEQDPDKQAATPKTSGVYNLGLDIPVKPQESRQATIPGGTSQGSKSPVSGPQASQEEPTVARPPTRPLPRVPFQKPAEAPEYARKGPPVTPVKNAGGGSGASKLDSELFDHPIIGGKFTICCLCYGDYSDLARRCLSSIVATVPRHRFDLYVAGNECCEITERYVKSLKPEKMSFVAGPRRKYPAMRELFYGGGKIKTNYTIWFDDDTWIVNAKWLQTLAQTIINNEKHKVGMYGWKHFHSLGSKSGADQRDWFRKGKWFRGKQFQNKKGQDAPNGDKIWFVPGYFWAIRTKVIYEADIPDTRLEHNGGDITCGEQVHQLGYKLKDFNRKKAQVCCPSKEKGGRRGFHQSFPWRR